MFNKNGTSRAYKKHKANKNKVEKSRLYSYFRLFPKHAADSPQLQTATTAVSVIEQTCGKLFIMFLLHVK